MKRKRILLLFPLVIVLTGCATTGKEKILAFQTEIGIKEFQLSEKDTEISELEDKNSGLTRFVRALQDKVRECEEDIHKSQKSLVYYQEIKEELTAKNTALGGQMQSLKKQYSELAKKYNALVQKYNEIGTNHDALVQKYKELEQERDEWVKLDITSAEGEEAARSAESPSI